MFVCLSYIYLYRLPLMKDLWIYFGGIVTALIAFSASRLADYFWMKSPRIALFGRPVSVYYHSGKPEVLINTDCAVAIRNFSKNEAYNISVESIVFDNDSIIAIPESIKISSTPVSDQMEGEIKFSCLKPVMGPQLRGSSQISYNDRIFNESAIITCSYQNQLGKKYKTKIHTKFITHKPSFFTF